MVSQAKLTMRNATRSSHFLVQVRLVSLKLIVHVVYAFLCVAWPALGSADATTSHYTFAVTEL